MDMVCKKLFIETKDLILKQAKMEDWKDIYQNLWIHVESARYMLWNVVTSEEEAIRRMGKTIEYEKKEPYALFVYEKKSEQAIGFATMHEINPQVWEVYGMAIGPKFVGKGYGKQILNALANEAFQYQDAKKFIVSYRTMNMASYGMQMACGFHYSYSEDKVDPRNGESYVIKYNVKERTGPHLYYHASPVANIQTLMPHSSNHNIPWTYFSEKKENVLVYLSNAVEKYCRETCFTYDGTWSKWGSYGFDENGILRLEEYYPNAIVDTYKGVSGYIYTADYIPGIESLPDIPNAVVTENEVPVFSCEYIPDAYEAIMKANKAGKITITYYKDMSEIKRAWIRKIVDEEYQKAVDHPDYQHFLRGKFHMEGQSNKG
ncbi:MAG TPA: GNAT family protein [Lachnospiraceae bacterium]|nr:GNAT family protein [Lachnospiraceae bacterium]